jgi:hypothetical protein
MAAPTVRSLAAWLWPSRSEIFEIPAERHGDPLEHFDRWVAPPILDPAQIGLVNLSPVGEFLLAQVLRAPHLLKIQTHSATYIHASIRDADLTSRHRL